MESIVDLLFPEFALSLLCFFLLTSLAQFLLVELLDLIIEFVTLLDKIVDSASELAGEQFLLLFLPLHSDRVSPDQLESVHRGLVHAWAQIRSAQVGCFDFFYLRIVQFIECIGNACRLIGSLENALSVRLFFQTFNEWNRGWP